MILYTLQRCDTQSSIFPLEKDEIFVILIFARNPKIYLRALAASVEDRNPLEDNLMKLCNINSFKSWSLSFQSSGEIFIIQENDSTKEGFSQTKVPDVWE